MNYDKILAISLFFVSLNVFAVEQVRSYSGLYVWGHEVNTFQPCGSEKVYWVIVPARAQVTLTKYYENGVTKRYQPIYIRFQGQKKGKATDGFAADYAGLIKVINIDQKTLVIPGKCR